MASDTTTGYLAPGVTWHGQTLGTIKGADSVTGMLRGFIGALPDLRAAEQDIVAAGDTVALRYVIEATQEGNLLGLAPQQPARH
jgi:predicted ester cyclase